MCVCVCVCCSSNSLSRSFCIHRCRFCTPPPRLIFTRLQAPKTARRAVLQASKGEKREREEGRREKREKRGRRKDILSHSAVLWNTTTSQATLLDRSYRIFLSFYVAIQANKLIIHMECISIICIISIERTSTLTYACIDYA